jgi:DNA-binding XRE family transcriptional regulator
MGRPAKNPEHPLTKLRKALSTPSQQMTRALFSKKVGIPETTIKAIETGKFKISDKNAAQIASVTKVNPKCLMDPSLPLTDYLGVPLTGQPFADFLGDEYLDVKALFDTAFEVAEEKGKQTVFSFLFQRWLEETSQILGLGVAIRDKLQEGYPVQCFAAIPQYFWPKDRKKRQDINQRVNRFEEELDTEILKKVTTDQKALLGRSPDIFDLLMEGKLRNDLYYADVAWDLRKKMIEEAKASPQKEPKGPQTR